MTITNTSVVRPALVVISTIALLWLIGLIFYSQRVPHTVTDTTTMTDAIVVLTGGSGRIDTGIDLLERGIAKRLFISGVAPTVSEIDIIAADRLDRENLLALIAMGSDAEDTHGNAIETEKWVRENGVNSIRLVTAAYHMPRSLSEFQNAMPDVKIISHPVFPEQVKADWWRYPGTASLLSSEYTKYLFAIVRMWFFVGTSSNETQVPVQNIPQRDRVNTQ